MSSAAARLGACLATLLILLAASSCDELLTDLEPDPESIAPEDILFLERSAGAVPLPANGTATDTIYAYLSGDATSRVVSFATSAGSFLPIPGAKAIDVRAEENGGGYRLVAKAVLRADTVATTAVVSAKVGEFVRYLPVTFVR